VDIVDAVVQMLGDAGHIGVGTDMSLGTYPDHRRDPWGEADYPDISAEYGRRVTPDIRSPRRSLDGFSDYREVVQLADELLRRGYTDAQVRGILGENYLRLFGEVLR
jgi:membrane dipeptidase